MIGFDDLASARLTNPPLTTVHQPVRALGHEMARMLVGAIDGQDPSPLILPTRLTVRESAPSPPSRPRPPPRPRPAGPTEGRAGGTCGDGREGARRPPRWRRTGRVRQA